jgi:hypothetical protein
MWTVIRQSPKFDCKFAPVTANKRISYPNIYGALKALNVDSNEHFVNYVCCLQENTKHAKENRFAKFRLFWCGQWHQVCVDGFLPYWFCLPEGWASLLCKAIAKLIAVKRRWTALAPKKCATELDQCLRSLTAIELGTMLFGDACALRKTPVPQSVAELVDVGALLSCCMFESSTGRLLIHNQPTNEYYDINDVFANGAAVFFRNSGDRTRRLWTKFEYSDKKFFTAKKNGQITLRAPELYLLERIMKQTTFE